MSNPQANDIPNLIQARSNIIAQIAALTLNPKPNYVVSGKSYSFGDYLGQLNQQLALINTQIDALSGPWEVVITGST